MVIGAYVPKLHSKEKTKLRKIFITYATGHLIVIDIVILNHCPLLFLDNWVEFPKPQNLAVFRRRGVYVS
jgi:hypothetical protein